MLASSPSARETPILPLSREVKAYIEAFDIAAIVTYGDGRIGVSRRQRMPCRFRQIGAQ
jgi:hypothetical protein